MNSTLQIVPDAVAGDFPVFGVVESSGGAPSVEGVDRSELDARRFEGKVGQTAIISMNGAATLLVGLGKDEVSMASARKIGAAVARAASNVESVSVPLECLSNQDNSQSFSEGALLASYEFYNFKSKSEPNKLAAINLVGANQTGVDRGNAIAKAVCMARDLVNTPPSDMTPIDLATKAQAVARESNLEITVWDESDIEREKLGGVMGVAKGSHQPARVIQLNYKAPNAKKTVALVGKGITFDSGGLSLKPPESMIGMKHDMAGSAAVLAAMSTLATLKPNVNVLGVMCCTENMPGGGATKVGDVLHMRNGKTVEVLNTDAEGRLVLGDGLALAVEAGADEIINIATLTGACPVALGRQIAGVMGNSSDVVGQVMTAGERAGEKYWELPLPEEYHSHIESDLADIKNIGKKGEAGTISAGLFLQEFVGDVPWAHLDIAGTADSDSEDGFLVKGATGFGVRTFVELLAKA